MKTLTQNKKIPYDAKQVATMAMIREYCMWPDTYRFRNSQTDDSIWIGLLSGIHNSIAIMLFF